MILKIGICLEDTEKMPIFDYSNHNKLTYEM